MKKVMLIAVMAIFSSGVFAAESKAAKPTDPTVTLNTSCGTKITFKVSFVNAQLVMGTWNTYLQGAVIRACAGSLQTTLET